MKNTHQDALFAPNAVKRARRCDFYQKLLNVHQCAIFVAKCAKAHVAMLFSQIHVGKEAFLQLAA